MHGYATATGLSWTIQKQTTTYSGRPLVSSRVGLERSEEPKLDPQNKENQIAAICVAAYERQCTGGLRMIIGGADSKNLPALFARLIMLDFAR